MTAAFVSRLASVSSLSALLVCLGCGQTSSPESEANGGQAGDGGAVGGAGAVGGGAAGSEASAGASSGAGAGSAGHAGAGGAEPACVFADPQLEAAVRKALSLGDGPILQSQAVALTTVSAEGVASLAGIECLTKLTHLIATDGTISDLSPVSALSELTSVQFARNDIADLSPLSGLQQLNHLGFISNHVTTLAGFTLPVLKTCSEFHLDRNPIEAAELTDACALGWPIFWGGNDGAPVQSCNSICLK
jgi:internalin A